MSTRLLLILAGAVLGCCAAFGHSAVSVGLGNRPAQGAMAPGIAGALSGTAPFSVGTSTGPGNMAIAPGPAGFQNSGIQNLPSQAPLSLVEGCTIPSPIFEIFSTNQPG